jgi:hypothetical protein
LGRIAEGAPGQAVLLSGEGALAIAGLVDEVLAEVPRFAVLRMHEVAERATKTETGFSTFMTLLLAGLGKAVRGAAARGEGQWGGGRPLAEWGEVRHGLGRLLSETERFNLDKRTAVIAGLELLSGS